MSTYLCLRCGEERGKHLEIPTVKGAVALLCPTATYQSASTREPLDLDRLSAPQTPTPGSPAAEGKVWDPVANRWIKPTPLGTESTE